MQACREPPLRFVYVTGEISGLRRQSSGHLYFRLKDADALLDCALWESSARLLRFDPADGQQVIAWGRVELYAPYGKIKLGGSSTLYGSAMGRTIESTGSSVIYPFAQ